MTRVVIVAPLREGSRETALLLVSQGPPFDPEGTTLSVHDVYVTDREVVFVFEGPNARQVIERLAGDPSVWKAATAWKECLAGRPRIAEQVYSWARPSDETG